jgi:hypothetical protein
MTLLRCLIINNNTKLFKAKQYLIIPLVRIPLETCQL